VGQAFLPAKGTAYLIQQSDEWLISPTSYPALDEHIVVSNQESSWNGATWEATGYMVENADGSRQGGLAVSWK
jgi:hypothetical protein